MKYEIQGETLPVVIIDLQPGEKIITESGAMAWMSPNMKMETSSNGGLGKVFGRMLSGDTIFQNIYTAEGGEGMIACASCFPGSIKPFEIDANHSIILQKSAFLCATEGVQLDTFFSKKFGSGLFGGEGFIMQKISGNGTCFAEFDGHIVEYDLVEGQQMIVDTGNLAAMSDTCTMDVVSVKGMKNALFGGEGLFHTIITGPGHIWLQTMPASALAEAISPYIVVPKSSN